MKKHILFAGAAMLATTAAIAKTIDFDTVINWNSEVIAAALNNSGFIGSSNAAWDVRVTHQRILDELVKKQSFSLRDATRVCLDKCNMSDFLKNGRGQSGKKCPELCTGFADALVAANNEYTNTGGWSTLNINFDTPVLWFKYVLNDAIQKAGLRGDLGEKIGLSVKSDLSKTNQFSCKEALYICMEHCNKSEDIRLGYGQTHRRCPQVCKDFIHILIKENNKYSDRPKLVLAADKRSPDKKFQELLYLNGTCLAHGPANAKGVYDLFHSNEWYCERMCREGALWEPCKLENIAWTKKSDQHGVWCWCNLPTGYKVSTNEYKIKKYNYTPTYKDCRKEFGADKCDNSVY